MIDQKELRIGNLISRPDIADGHIRIEKILEIGEKAMTTGPIKILCSYEDLVPIPITPDWIERLGFYRGYNKNLYHSITIKAVESKEIQIYFENDEVSLFLIDDEWSEVGVVIPHIKYVHQLQNLYFALTGEEL